MRLLQLIRQNFQIARQFVLGFELFGKQDQIARGVVQRNVTQVQAAPVHSMKDVYVNIFWPCILRILPGQILQIENARRSAK